MSGLYAVCQCLAGSTHSLLPADTGYSWRQPTHTVVVGLDYAAVQVIPGNYALNTHTPTPSIVRLFKYNIKKCFAQVLLSST